MLVTRYRPDGRPGWNEFVAASRNGTFLLHRDYLEYHEDRFVDHSLVLRDGEGSISALLPANEREGALHSHGGLTYGGLILSPRCGACDALQMLEVVRDYLRAAGLAALHYKTIPWIYHRQPSEEDRYALFRLDAVLSRRDVLSVVPREDRLRYQQRRARGAKAAKKLGVAVAESGDFGAFWRILDDNLRARHGVGPVHTVDEIRLLKSRFPDSIRLFCAQRDGRMVAGVVVYETPRVAHVQYISANDEGREGHALDACFDHLLNDVFGTKPYFDFGISNEEAGRMLNAGLVEQKEGFGARTVVHDYYELAA